MVKYRDVVTGIHVDIVFDNALGVCNTNLLRAYADFDPRFADLALLIKYWTKRRSINDTYSGTLSSYAYLILLVNFLQ